MVFKHDYINKYYIENYLLEQEIICNDFIDIINKQKKILFKILFNKISKFFFVI